MTWRPCIVCGVLTQGTRCPAHYRRRVTPGRTTRPQMAFRAAVLAAAGHRCQWVEGGRRCEVTTGLTAHHVQRFVDVPSYNPADGVALCLPHHREAERRLTVSAANSASYGPTAA